MTLPLDKERSEIRSRALNQNGIQTSNTEDKVKKKHTLLRDITPNYSVQAFISVDEHKPDDTAYVISQSSQTHARRPLVITHKAEINIVLCVFSVLFFPFSPSPNTDDRRSAAPKATQPCNFH